MKLTQDIIRKLIKEVLTQSEIEKKAEAIFAMLGNLEGQAATVLSLVDRKLSAEDQTNERKLTELEKEKKWSDTDHDEQEEIAKEIEKENPGISKEKKMAFAGAQVNREKRKRNK